MSDQPSYVRVFLTFARNSLIRDMTFRLNFVLDCISSLSWALMNMGFYLLIFNYTNQIGADTGWGKYEFFAFLATTMLINSLVQTFFMPNCEELSEMIRNGGLDFVLLKPIDAQFLISMKKIEWSSLSNFVFGIVLLAISVGAMTAQAETPSLVLRPIVLLLYPFYVLCGVAILYSLMITLSASSIWLGRNQTLYDFWFYITNFSRYPMEIYQGRWGSPLQWLFTFIIPVLVVVNVPAQIIAQPLRADPRLAIFALFATVGCLAASRWFFNLALARYRSASS